MFKVYKNLSQTNFSHLVIRQEKYILFIEIESLGRNPALLVREDFIQNFSIIF